MGRKGLAPTTKSGLSVVVVFLILTVLHPTKSQFNDILLANLY